MKTAKSFTKEEQVRLTKAVQTAMAHPTADAFWSEIEEELNRRAAPTDLVKPRVQRTTH